MRPPRLVPIPREPLSPPGAGRPVDLDMRAVRQGFGRRAAGARKFHGHRSQIPRTAQRTTDYTVSCMAHLQRYADHRQPEMMTWMMPLITRRHPPVACRVCRRAAMGKSLPLPIAQPEIPVTMLPRIELNSTTGNQQPIDLAITQLGLRPSQSPRAATVTKVRTADLIKTARLRITRGDFRRMDCSRGESP